MSDLGTEILHSPWKMLVGKTSLSYWCLVTFSGAFAVKLQGGIWIKCHLEFLHHFFFCRTKACLPCQLRSTSSPEVRCQKMTEDSSCKVRCWLVVYDCHARASMCVYIKMYIYIYALYITSDLREHPTTLKIKRKKRLTHQLILLHWTVQGSKIPDPKLLMPESDDSHVGVYNFEYICRYIIYNYVGIYNIYTNISPMCTSLNV